MKIRCSECGRIFCGDERQAEIKMDRHECSIDLSELSDNAIIEKLTDDIVMAYCKELLARIRKAGKIGSAEYSDWQKRPGYWYLDFMEITKTKFGEFRLWDNRVSDTVGIFSKLAEAKRQGVKIVNQILN